MTDEMGNTLERCLKSKTEPKTKPKTEPEIDMKRLSNDSLYDYEEREHEYRMLMDEDDPEYRYFRERDLEYRYLRDPEYRYLRERGRGHRYFREREYRYMREREYRYLRERERRERERNKAPVGKFFCGSTCIMFVLISFPK